MRARRRGRLACLGALGLLFAPRESAAVELGFVDAAGRPVAAAKLARAAPPAALADPEGVRVLARAPAGELPAAVTVSSLPAPDGGARVSVLDQVRDLSLSPAPCPAGTPADRACAVSGSVRLVGDDVDRGHPLLSDRSLLAELGGALTATAGTARALVRVAGAHDRTRARLRVHVVRMTERGPLPIGRDAADAARMVREDVARAGNLWGTCGVSFGPPDEVEVKVVDPPPPWLLAVGCGAGLPASGGEVQLAVDGRPITVPVPPGTTPRGAARLVAAAIERRGFVVGVSDNAVSGASARPTADVTVRTKSGKPAVLAAPRSGQVSTDATLEACIGRVALEDGLQHFADADAVTGTLEERTLIRAFDDGDTSTLDVFVIPSFGGDARIGESFIFADAGTIKNVVLVDRAGFRAHRASFTLAHEIGHVLLDQPGHPDDFGVDDPSRLMDADAVNPTAFGPRRLDAAECARAMRQSGPRAPGPVLATWPLAPAE